MIRFPLFARVIDFASLACLLALAVFPAVTAVTALLTGFQASPPAGAASPGGAWGFVAYILSHSDSGGQLPAGAGLLRALALLAAVVWLLRPRRTAPEVRPVLLAGGGFLAVALASALASEQVGDALVSWGDLLATGLCFLLAADLAREYRHLPVLRLGALVLLTVVAFVLVAAYGIFLVNPDPQAAMFGSFYQPNILAGYLMLVLPLTVVLFLEASAEGDPDQGWSLAAGVALVVVTMAVYLTYSRGAWLVGALALVLALALLPARGSRSLAGRACVALLALAGALGAVFAALGGQPVLAVAGGLLGRLSLAWLLATLPGFRRRLAALALLVLLGLSLGYGMTGAPGVITQHAVVRAGHLATGEDTSAAARVEFWKAAVRMAGEHPWLGVGLEGFHRYYPARQGDLRWFAKYTHSLFFSLVSETGLLATGLFLAALVAGALLGGRLLARDTITTETWPFPGRTVRLGLLLGVAAFLVHSQIDVHWHFPALPMTMALLAGLALGAPPAREVLPPLGEEDEARSPWSVRPGMLAQYAGSLALMALVALNGRVTQADFLASVARAAAQAGQPEKAVTLWVEATGANPWEGEHHRNLGLLLLDRVYSGQVSPEERQLLLDSSARALEQDRHRAVTWSLRGRALEVLSRLDEAEPCYRRALELDPVNYPSFYVDMARLQARRGHVEQARQFLEASLERFPEKVLEQMFFFRTDAMRDQLSDAYLNLGLMTPIGEPRRMAWLERALALQETSPGARFALAAERFEKGRRLEEQGKASEAAGDFRRAAELLRELYADQPGRGPVAEYLRALDGRGY